MTEPLSRFIALYQQLDRQQLRDWLVEYLHKK